MTTRSMFKEEHTLFRESARRFFEAEVAPHRERWEEAGQIDRETWTKAGEMGFLCPTMPERYGGFDADRLYSVILMEEQARIGATGPGFSLHSEIVAPYILNYGDDTQKETWLPRMAKGEAIGAIAMTEPGTGSDLQGVKTTAIRKGDDYVINGAKTFITNGYMSDLVIVVCKTDPSEGAKGTSLILVEADREGFSKGRKLKKLGLKAQDTAELFFDDVRVPVSNRLGQEGHGFYYLMQELPWERMQIAISSMANSEAIFEETAAYTKERKAFGREIAAFQNTRFKLAEMKTEITVGRTFVDDCIARVVKGELDPVTGAMAKCWATEMESRIIDQCLQLHGGYGFMWEYRVARAYADARVHRIYGGTNEIMKEVIGRSI